MHLSFKSFYFKFLPKNNNKNTKWGKTDKRGTKSVSVRDQGHGRSGKAGPSSVCRAKRWKVLRLLSMLGLRREGQVT